VPGDDIGGVADELQDTRSCRYDLDEIGGGAAAMT
jgi:hypothetical protein